MGPDQLTGVMTQVAVQSAKAYSLPFHRGLILGLGRNWIKRLWERERRGSGKMSSYSLVRIILVRMLLMMG